ncbi:MAG TPA: M28 family peptidase [Gemmatimonadales bacterium]|nr:M28 family peptidase [Gemmatimonadales bacterium]
MRYVHALLLAALPGLAAAQRQQPSRTGAGAITSADVRRRIDLIADDSMLGRATPSHQLDVAAAYVASEFRRFGLKPGGDSGTYVQRYPLDVIRFDPDSVTIRVTGPAPATWRGGRDVLLLQGKAPEKATAGPAVVITGSPDSGGGLDSTAVAGKVVFFAVGRGFNAIAGKVMPLRPLAVMLVAGFPDSIWERLPGRTPGMEVINPNEGDDVPVPAVFAVRSATVAPLLAQGGAPRDSIRVWDDRPLAAHHLRDVTLELDVREPPSQHTAAPNVVGVLEGGDAALKNEYVLFTAHLDHIGTPSAGEGCVARGGDSICNGADDDGSGSVAVLELAHAFASAPATERPKRSLVFMTVSGEERGLWGSAYFADHPTVPLANVVADLNIDMVGRNSKDTVAVIGREHSNLGALLDSVAAQHRDLNIKPVGDLWPQEHLYYRSDHYNFAKKGVPILFFTTGLHPDYHQVSDSPDKIDAEKEARFGRLVFYLGLAVANAGQRPQWNPQSYKQIVGGAK